MDFYTALAYLSLVFVTNVLTLCLGNCIYKQFVFDWCSLQLLCNLYKKIIKPLSRFSLSQSSSQSCCLLLPIFPYLFPESYYLPPPFILFPTNHIPVHGSTTSVFFNLCTLPSPPNLTFFPLTHFCPDLPPPYLSTLLLYNPPSTLLRLSLCPLTTLPPSSYNPPTI